MHVTHQDQLAFHLTGHVSTGALEPIEGRGLLPALFAPVRDLAALRHDYPLVLAPGTPARSLAALFDAAISGAGEGEAAERLRGHAMRVERVLRRIAAEGAAERLSAAWELAVARIGGSEPGLRENLDRLRLALPREGVLAGCDRALPARLLAHEWGEAQRTRTERLRATIGTLAGALENLLKADFAGSAAARSPERLRAAMGGVHAGIFDFDTMARLLSRAAPVAGLDEGRRRRIDWLLTVLRGQHFAPVAGSRAAPYEFAFTSAAAALQAWRERLAEAGELARAIAMAGLEVAGEYNEAKHDPLFAAFGAGQPPGADFPSYLVCLADRALTPDESALVLEALGTGLPFKVLAQTDDLLEPGSGMAALGLRLRPLAAAALGLGDAYVLQAGAAQLVAQLPRLRAGLAFAGPALVSVYSGAGADTAPLPPYLVSAAAAEARAFPAFAYDPGAGPDWAARFTLEGNPQAGRDWPEHALGWEDAALRRQGETVAFTLIDFLACDRRAAPHFARVAPAAWNARMVPVAVAVAQAAPDPDGHVPCTLMADPEGGLHKVLADGTLLREARRCLARWRALQELGGINNSHAARAVATARAAWEVQAAVVAPVAAPAAAPAPVAAEAAAPAPAEPEAGHDPALPYIETARCSSCNECIRLNDRMFGYDANRQARIIDPSAGTYRQLVEAAESCQVSVIHPGRPRDQDEPGLEELLERAAPFL